MYRRTKEEKKAWWASLSQTEKAKYVERWEHQRDVPDRQPLDIPALSVDEMRAINDDMRRLGLEKLIVLPD